MQLGNAVRAAREAKGWSQKRLEAETGIPQPRLSHIETGYRNEKATLEIMMKIESAMGLQRGWILGFAGVVTPEGAERGARQAAKEQRPEALKVLRGVARHEPADVDVDTSDLDRLPVAADQGRGAKAKPAPTQRPRPKRSKG